MDGNLLTAAQQSSPRLVIVSNRVPADGATPGGLAVAMADAMRDRECLWFGWDGDAHAEASGDIRFRQDGRTTYALMSVAESDFAGYYEGYANSTLWPAWHYRLDLSTFDQRELDAYLQVNQVFAERLASLIRPDDIIWVHDYHLIPMINRLRELGVKNPIGFFSHIPFPSPEIFCAIPGCSLIAEGLLSADVAGFQSRQDKENFERYVATRLGGYWLPDGRISAGGHIVKPGAFPIGIDAAACRTLAVGAGATPELQRFRNQLGERPLVIGVDRLDYSKGLNERIDAFDQFLSGEQHLDARPTLLQIAPVSRGNVKAYVQLREQLEHRIGNVNGRHAELDWTPVQFLTTPVPRFQIAALLRIARVGLITPLRDGMNLVAKEFVAAQDPDDPGVLILSQFAGAAEQLTAALIINPHDTRQQARAIHQALEMPLEERQERHHALMVTLLRQDSAWWCNEFLGELASVQRWGARLASSIGDHFASASAPSPSRPQARRV